MKRLHLVLAVLVPMLSVCAVSLPMAGCATTPGVGEPSPAQQHAAARAGVTAAEKTAVTWHQADVLRGEEWQASHDGIMAARELLSPAASAEIGDYIPAIVAALKTAGYAIEAAQIVAKAATLTDDEIAVIESKGTAQDAVYDAYYAAHPN